MGEFVMNIQISAILKILEDLATLAGFPEGFMVSWN